MKQIKYNVNKLKDFDTEWYYIRNVVNGGMLHLY